MGLIVGEDSQGELYFLLTLRSDKLASHPRQIALPGGLAEDSDGKDLLNTLAREVFEEVGIPAEQIMWESAPWDSVMSLGEVEVHPYLGFLKTPLEKATPLAIAPNEVERAEWIKLSQLFDALLWKQRSYQAAGSSHSYEMPVWSGWFEETWGLTAVLLYIFVSRISGRPPH